MTIIRRVSIVAVFVVAGHLDAGLALAVPPWPLSPAARQSGALAPLANTAAGVVAVVAFWVLARRSRRAPQPGEFAGAPAPRWATQARLVLVLSAGLLAVCWPTSINGSLSRTMVVLAILGTAVALGTAAVLPGGRGSRAAVVNSVLTMGLLGVATVFTPLTSYSPGGVFIYLGLVLLLVLDVRDLRPGRAGLRAFVALNVIIIALGLGTLLGVEPINRILAGWYTYYRPELIREMIAGHKPVVMFNTHSLAGFVFYLLGTAALAGARRGAGWWALAGVYLVLMAALRSVTGNILFVLGAAQAAWLASRQFPRLRRPLLVTAAVAASALAAWLVLAGTAGADMVRSLFVGDGAHGFPVRFGPGGLMRENLDYLRQYPLTPIGFGFSEQLYLGDCGILVTLLRGGLPVVAGVYGGLLAFFRRNICDGATAAWLWAVTTAFEVGFQPLQTFRFVALLPLYVVCLNALLERADARVLPSEAVQAGSAPRLRRLLRATTSSLMQARKRR